MLLEWAPTFPFNPFTSRNNQKGISPCTNEDTLLSKKGKEERKISNIDRINFSWLEF